MDNKQILNEDKFRKIDDLFNDIAEDDFGKADDELVAKLTAEAEEKQSVVEKINSEKYKRMIKAYRDYKNLDENFEITEENLDEYALNKIATENNYNYNRYRKILLKKENK